MTNSRRTRQRPRANSADAVQPRRRLRLQARTWRAGARRAPPERCSPRPPARGASTPATTPPCGNSTTSGPSSRPPTSSRRWSTMRAPGAVSQRPTACPTSTRWAVARSSRSTWSAGTPTRLPTELLGEVLAGGQDIADEAGFVVAGGHTIDDPEPKYGMAVTGEAHPDRLLTNAGLRAGQDIVLTKALGVGVLTTAIKAERATPEQAEAAVASMVRLNDIGARLALAAGATGCTDVTGFGLLGHLGRMALESAVTCRRRVRRSAVPARRGRPRSRRRHARRQPPQPGLGARLRRRRRPRRGAPTAARRRSDIRRPRVRRRSLGDGERSRRTGRHGSSGRTDRHAPTPAVPVSRLR